MGGRKAISIASCVALAARRIGTRSWLRRIALAIPVASSLTHAAFAIDSAQIPDEYTAPMKAECRAASRRHPGPSGITERPAGKSDGGVRESGH